MEGCVSMQKHVWIPDDWNDKKANVIPVLNKLLNDVGISFEVRPPKEHEKYRGLYITVNEDVLEHATKKSTGRPTEHKFDYQRVMELKEKGLTNKQIADELGISISLFYLRMKDYKNNNWTMLEQKKTKKWELVYDTDEEVIATGYVSSDLDVMTKVVAYMNRGKKSDLPDYIIDDLEAIKKMEFETYLSFISSNRGI